MRVVFSLRDRPFSKTGGWPTSRRLPVALAELGLDVTVISPSTAAPRRRSPVSSCAAKTTGPTLWIGDARHTVRTAA